MELNMKVRQRETFITITGLEVTEMWYGDITFKPKAWLFNRWCDNDGRETQLHYWKLNVVIKECVPSCNF